MFVQQRPPDSEPGEDSADFAEIECEIYKVRVIRVIRVIRIRVVERCEPTQLQ